MIGLDNWAERVRAARRGLEIGIKATVKYDETPLKRRCHEMDYTKKNVYKQQELSKVIQVYTREPIRTYNQLYINPHTIRKAGKEK